MIVHIPFNALAYFGNLFRAEANNFQRGREERRRLKTLGRLMDVRMQRGVDLSRDECAVLKAYGTQVGDELEIAVKDAINHIGDVPEMDKELLMDRVELLRARILASKDLVEAIDEACARNPRK